MKQKILSCVNNLLFPSKNHWVGLLKDHYCSPKVKREWKRYKIFQSFEWLINDVQMGSKKVQMSLGNFAFYSCVFQICWASETRHLWCRKSGKKKSSKSNIMTRFCMIVMLQFSLGEVERGKNWPLWHKRPFVPWITNKLLLSCFTMLRLIFQDYTKKSKIRYLLFCICKVAKNRTEKNCP